MVGGGTALRKRIPPLRMRWLMPPLPTAPATPEDYVTWLNQRLGQEVRRRREALGLSAYALGKVVGVTDQTILNLEQGLCPNGCWMGTLARIARHFGLRLRDLIEAAEGGGET